MCVYVFRWGDSTGLHHMCDLPKQKPTQQHPPLGGRGRRSSGQVLELLHQEGRAERGELVPVQQAPRACGMEWMCMYGCVVARKTISCVASHSALLLRTVNPQSITSIPKHQNRNIKAHRPDRSSGRRGGRRPRPARPSAGP